ncbi:BamA/TamA family outer membrane protein [Mucilaginibacter sp. JRF]|uniref:translocation and assembly module lipoprotein TamL n=1 Tax=Mucilaginibacter sp. JRF TaxID=2780088 RepID=UPI00188261D2|nr:BamA/TamA family outer membrane protein [Mucilaginibacter sp. JRF]MBE9584367.1 BamA/TamA family outer membrane protein [Mucilaginibacter sp. JRF]
MIKHIKYILVLCIFLSACSNTKYLQPGQKLYTGGKVKIVDNDSLKKSDRKALEADLTPMLRPKPNSSLLGLRFKLYIYNKTRTNKTKGFKHWLNTKFGEPPVLASQVNLEKNSQILQNRLQNKSYFQATVSGDTISKNKTASAEYTVSTGPAYKIRSVTFPKGNESLDTAIAGTAGETLLKPGEKYDLDIIKNERLRIDAKLKEKGFFYFAPEDIIMRIDSTVNNHQVDIFVAIKPEVNDRDRRIYTINKLYVYPNYSLTDTALHLDDAVSYRWYNVVDRRKTIRPFAFKNTVLMQPGNVYNRTQHNNSLNRFVNLGPYKFVKNRFEPAAGDSSKLDAYYFLTPYPKKSIQLDLLGRTNSANFTGTQINLNWKHRNAFKGAELLTMRLFGSSDVQFSGQGGGFNVYQVGGEMKLTWPRFIAPINIRSDNAYIPHTNLTLGYTLINRTNLYTLNSFNGSFGYDWKQNVHRSHELNILNINFVNPANVTQLYRDSIARTNNPALQHVIDRQFTFGPSYGYTFTNTTEEYRTNTLFYNGRISSSAVLTGLISGADTLAGNVKNLFGTPFNQYVKIENDLRFYHKTGQNSSIATRLMVGVGVPFGNSTVMPYSQQFFIGGSNSLRGFRARSIGPGTYYAGRPEDGGFLPDQAGDIRIEGNVEWRPKLFSIVRGAVFVDAGNIWLMRDNGAQPGATFGKDFYKELAVDAGIGLRFDVTVLVLRTDLGFPIRKPWLPEGQRWVIDKIDFGSSAWRHENLVFNLAIGYPF